MSEHSFPLQQIYFYITQGCNLSCRHCWISPGNETSGSQKAVLSVSAFEKVIEEAKPLGLKSVKITGGEPLLNTNIIDMLNIVSRERLGLVLETNATLCRPEHVTAIKSACQKPFVTVSLDGADATTHDYIRGVPGSYDSALRGIAYLVNEGIKPQIIFTVMRHNQHQVDLMPRLAEALGAGSLKFNVVQPSQRGQKLHQEHETLSIEELVALGRRVEPMGEGEALIRMVNASSQVSYFARTMDNDTIKSRRINREWFANLNDLAAKVPIYQLNLSLTGRFWKLVESVISGSVMHTGRQ